MTLNLLKVSNISWRYSFGRWRSLTINESFLPYCYLIMLKLFPSHTHRCRSRLYLPRQHFALLSFHWSKVRTKNLSDSDCTFAVTSKPTCPKFSWSLFNTDSLAVEQVQDGCLFCCDAGYVRPSWWPVLGFNRSILDFGILYANRFDCEWALLKRLRSLGEGRGIACMWPSVLTSSI